MVVDWIEAIKVAGLGFGTVFIVLIILWVVTSVMGIIYPKKHKRNRIMSQGNEMMPRVKLEDELCLV